MKIPNDAIIPQEKLTRYLLITRLKDDKSKYLSQGGFTQANPEDLLTAIRQLIINNEAVEDNINEYGIFYVVEGNLQGINKRNLSVVTVWLQSKYDRKFRFITLKPKKN